MNNIPVGYCQCGCGRQTAIATRTTTRAGHVKGQPYRFCAGHKIPKIPPLPRDESIPVGLCQCGCGQKTPIASRTVRARGWIAGQPVRFARWHGAYKGTLELMFWSHVTKGTPDDCWHWGGYIDLHGYGMVRFAGKLHRAHRVSYELHHGPIPTGAQICHHCDNPACVNPAHLFAGTSADNAHDMISKGRAPKDRCVKLTAEQVVELRRLAAAGVSNVELAVKFGISDTQTWKIVSRRAWKHVP